MRIIKRMLALSLSLIILMISGAQAEIPFLIHSNGWNLDDTPVDVVLKADVETHMPFDDDRLAMLTPITDLLSLRIVTGQDEGLVSIGIDGAEALTLQVCGNQVQASCMPGITYTADADPVSALIGADTAFTGVYESLYLHPDGESLIQDGRELMERLPTVLEAKAKKTKNTTNISGYGKTAYIIDFSFTAKQAEDLQEGLLNGCPEGWLSDIIDGLTFSGKQTIRMYFSAEDALLRMEYNGSCGPEGDLRTVKLVYKQLHNEEVDKDYIELTSPAKKGKNKNNLTFERTVQTNKKGARTIVGSFKYTATAGEITNIWNGEFNLSNAFTEDADVLGGDFTIQTRLNGDDLYGSTTIAPSLTITGTEEAPVITGSVTITEKYAQKVTEKATISIDLQKANPLQWQDTERVIDLSAMNAEALGAVREDFAAATATALVRPLIVLMGKDAEYFFREMPEDAIQSILDAAASNEE